MMEESKAKRIKNEQTFKLENEDRQELAEEILREEDKSSVPVQFVCECARATCHEVIEMTIRDYRKVHRKKNLFVVKAGHQHTDIENVVGKDGRYLVVQKPSISPV